MARVAVQNGAVLVRDRAVSCECCGDGGLFVRLRECCRDPQDPRSLWMPVTVRCGSESGPLVFDPATPEQRTFNDGFQCYTILEPFDVRTISQITAEFPTPRFLDPATGWVTCVNDTGNCNDPGCPPCDGCCQFNRNSLVCQGNFMPPATKCCECGRDVRVRIEFQRQSTTTAGGAIPYQVLAGTCPASACSQWDFGTEVISDIASDAYLQYRYQCGVYTWEQGNTRTTGAVGGDLYFPPAPWPCTPTPGQWVGLRGTIINDFDNEWNRNIRQEAPCGLRWDQVAASLGLPTGLDGTAGLPLYWECGFALNQSFPHEPVALCANGDVPVFFPIDPTTHVSRLTQSGDCTSGSASYTSVTRYPRPIEGGGGSYPLYTRVFTRWSLAWSIEILQPCSPGESPCPPRLPGTNPFPPLPLIAPPGGLTAADFLPGLRSG